MTDLQEAFREAARREFAMVPDENELDYTFSPGFQRKMQRIIRAQVHGYWNMVNTLGKRIAIAAAIIVMLLTTAMAIKPIRERVIQFFVEVYEEYFSITFGEKESGDLYPVVEDITTYTLSQIPDGYKEVVSYQIDTILFTIWKNEDGQDILLSQGIGSQEITLDHTSDNLIIINHNDLLISHLVLAEANSFVWEQNGYVFQLMVSDNISLNETLEMIDSLTTK